MKRKSLVVALLAGMTLSLTACAVTAKGIAPKEEETVEESAEAEETEAAVEDSEDEPEADSAEDDSESEDAVADAEEEDVDDEDEEEEKEAASSRYEKGIVTGTSFESAWIGLRYDMPDGFTMATEEELDAILKLGSEMLYEDGADMVFDYAKMTLVYEMMAVDPANNSVTILVERTAAKPEDLANMLEAQMAGVDGFEMKLVDAEEDAQICGIEFYKYSYELSYSGASVYQDYYITERNGRLIEVLVSYADESIREIMMDGFSPY